MKSSVMLWPSAHMRKSGRSAIESVDLGTADMMVGPHTCLLHQHQLNSIAPRNLQAMPTRLQPGLRERANQRRDSRWWMYVLQNHEIVRVADLINSRRILHPPL